MAINLSSTNHVLRVTTDGTEAIDVVAAYADWTSAAPFVPDSQETLITTATTTTIVSAPGASTVRMVKHVSITNTSATSANVIVDVYDGSNNHECGTWDLAQDESIVYDGQKWSKRDDSTTGVKISYQADAPASPSTGDLWYETDTNIWWFWNGTYWLSCQLFSQSAGGSALAANYWNYRNIQNDQAVAHDIFVVDLCASLYVNTTNDGTNYWNVYLYQLDRASNGTSLGSFNTSADTVTQFTIHKVQIDTHLDVSALEAEGTPDGRALAVLCSKTNSPGTLDYGWEFTYRLAHL